MHISSNNNQKPKFKILALDGGGIRGVVVASILQEVEKQIGKPLNQYFDLIAGTSTGAILAAGLAIGMKPESLRKIYEEKGKEIFPNSWFREIFRWVWGAKYSNEGLIKVLREQLGEITLCQVDAQTSTELLILAYDTFYRNTTFFTSRSPDSSRWFNNMKLWEVCTASASAPTFFPPYEFKWIDPNDLQKKEWSFPHVDGGVSAACPSLGALSHVIDVRGKNLEDITILSIGTGRTTKPIKYESMKQWGTVWWGKNIPDVFTAGQIQITTDTCSEIINSVNNDGYLRLQFDVNTSFNHPQDPLAPKDTLPPYERKNEFIQEKINEAMDDISTENIQKLIKAAEIFAERKRDVIKKFIENQD